MSSGCEACSLSLQNVTIKGQDGKTGLQIAGGQGRIRIEQVSISGYQTGLQIQLTNNQRTEVAVNGVSVDCMKTGVELAAPQLTVRNIRIAGCSDDGIVVTTLPGTPASNITVIGATAENNANGLTSYGPSRTAIFESVFVGNREFGVNAQPNGWLSIERSTLRDNGFPATSGRASGGLLAVSTGYVHNSSFEGNAFGVIPVFEVAYDATNNYWGDPLGPSLCSAGVTASPLGGDCVNHLVRFAPFRSQPPS